MSERSTAVRGGGSLKAMAQYTKFPTSPPPTAPARAATSHLLLRGYIILLFAAALGSPAVYLLAGTTGSIITILAFTAVSLAIWIPEIVRARPAKFEWRRLPWSALVYVALAGASVLWSQWLDATVMTWMLLAFLTAGALFVAHSLTWREVLRTIASALKWLLGLSLAIELWVALILRHPLLPNFVEANGGTIEANRVWVQGNLFVFFDNARIQGIVGDANALAGLCLLALIVFGVLFAARVRWRATLVLWILLALFLLIRTESITMLVAGVAVAITFTIALLIRRAEGPRSRTGLYLIMIASAVVAIVLAFLGRERLLGLLDRGGTQRTLLWQSVLERSAEHPVLGLGFSSPWVPTEPAIGELLQAHEITAFHAHNMWLDVRFQLGWIGLVLLAAVYATLLWRAWFFAVDRPRWDLRADRPYSPLTLAPLLITVMLLVQSLTDSAPMMLGGWMLAVLLNFKLRAVPLLGIGLSEAERTIERGAAVRLVP